jgi:hypothetical protein
MDIVYLVKNNEENDSRDLRYSLRSLQNLPEASVFLVGEKPAWAQNVTHIPVDQTKTKNENVAMNRTAAIRSEDISEDFVLMNDDFFIMKPITEIPRLNFGLMKDVLCSYRIRYPEGSDYIQRMGDLYELLKSQGFEEPLSYELHVPMQVKKSVIIRLQHERAGKPMHQFRTYYGNHTHMGGESVEDVKIFLDHTHNPRQYVADPEGYLNSQTFLSTTGGVFDRGLAGEFVRSAFPGKSRFEK